MMKRRPYRLICILPLFLCSDVFAGTTNRRVGSNGLLQRRNIFVGSAVSEQFPLSENKLRTIRPMNNGMFHARTKKSNGRKGDESPGTKHSGGSEPSDDMPRTSKRSSNSESAKRSSSGKSERSGKSGSQKGSRGSRKSESSGRGKTHISGKSKDSVTKQSRKTEVSASGKSKGRYHTSGKSDSKDSATKSSRKTQESGSANAKGKKSKGDNIFKHPTRSPSSGSGPGAPSQSGCSADSSPSCSSSGEPAGSPSSSGPNPPSGSGTGCSSESAPSCTTGKPTSPGATNPSPNSSPPTLPPKSGGPTLTLPPKTGKPTSPGATVSPEQSPSQSPNSSPRTPPPAGGVSTPSPAQTPSSKTPIPTRSPSNPGPPPTSPSLSPNSNPTMPTSSPAPSITPAPSSTPLPTAPPTSSPAPTTTFAPSMAPTSSPAPTTTPQPSAALEECTVDQSGFFGAINGNDDEIVYFYQVETESFVEEDDVNGFLSDVEDAISSTLLPSLFPQQCAAQARTNRKRRRLNSVGFSSSPADAVLSGVSCLGNTIVPGSNCFVVDGGCTIYTQEGSNVASEIEKARAAIRDAMDNGEYDNVNPNIIRVTFRNETNVEEVIGQSNGESDESGDGDGTDLAWLWASLGTCGFLIITVGVLKLIRRRARDRDNSYEEAVAHAEFSSVASDKDRLEEESMGDNEIFIEGTHALMEHDENAPSSSMTIGQSTSQSGEATPVTSNTTALTAQPMTSFLSETPVTTSNTAAFAGRRIASISTEATPIISNTAGAALADQPLASLSGEMVFESTSSDKS